MMIDLPDYIRDDKYTRKYTKLNSDNSIVGMWERKEDSRDYNEEYVEKEGITNVRTVYHGEWVAVPDDEIERLNDEKKKNKMIWSCPDTERLTTREKELEATKALLAALVAAHGGDK